MDHRIRSLLVVAAAVAIGVVVGRVGDHGRAAAQPGALTALDYQEITQLINRYAYGIDTCANNGYDYANLFTTDGTFTDRNSDAGFAAGGRVLAQGRLALATLVGGGCRGCATKLVWTGSVARHGGYEDVYVRTPEGWRIRSRTHVRNKAWHSEKLRTPDLN
jgi:hypothetical protein